MGSKVEPKCLLPQLSLNTVQASICSDPIQPQLATNRIRLGSQNPRTEHMSQMRVGDANHV